MNTNGKTFLIKKNISSQTKPFNESHLMNLMI